MDLNHGEYIRSHLCEPRSKEEASVKLLYLSHRQCTTRNGVVEVTESSLYNAKTSQWREVSYQTLHYGVNQS